MLIKNGRVYAGGKFVEKDITVSGGKVESVGRAKEDEEERIDVTGLLVLPGLIDLHVHLREPGYEKKEDFRTGTRAAVAGGLVHVFDMPNNKVPVTTAALFREKLALAARKTVCKTGFYLGASSGNELEWKKLDKEPAFAGLKIYMGQSTGSLLVDGQKSLEAHFANFDAKRPVVVHAEAQTIIEKRGRTEEAALAAVEQAAKLAKKYSKKLHIAHASTGAEVKLAKKEYPQCTLETCPHYLFISEKELAALGPLKNVNPPVRSDATRKTLWEALDRVDCISTDHAPHTIEDKESGASGYPGLETSLGLMLDAHSRGLVVLERVIRMMAENPARIIGLARNGSIAPGMNADFTIIDLRKEWTVKGDELETKCKWSPFEGRKLKGRNVKTVVGGKLIYDEGEILA